MGIPHFFGHTICATLIQEGPIMKKFGLLILSIILVFSLVACGRRNEAPKPTETTPTTIPATQPVTEPSIMPTMPEIDPTLDTNIPDPSVNGNSTDTTDTTIGDNTDSTDNAGGVDRSMP